jgi:carbon storage regulator CsrA
MLVISRSVDEAIRISDTIRVKVLKLGQRRVTLGVEAPSEVAVRRDEVMEHEGMAEQITPQSDLRVLVVEDTPVHALLIERVLSKRGIKNIVRTTSGEDAMRLLELAAQSQVPRPDLILLDLQLPGVSGDKVLEQIKGTPSLRAIPVVVLSCSDSDTDVARCLAAGANAFISKADNYEEFRRSVIKITDFWSQAARLVG